MAFLAWNPEGVQSIGWQYHDTVLFLSRHWYEQSFMYLYLPIYVPVYLSMYPSSYIYKN